MDNVLTVEIVQSLHRLVQCILAEAFRIVSLEVLKHLSECTAVHEFEEDPEPPLEIKCLVTLDDRLVTAQLHNSDFVHYAFSLCLRFWLNKLESVELFVLDFLDAEHSSEAANSFLTDDFVVL